MLISSTKHPLTPYFLKIHTTLSHFFPLSDYEYTLNSNLSSKILYLIQFFSRFFRISQHMLLGGFSPPIFSDNPPGPSRYDVEKQFVPSNASLSHRFLPVSGGDFGENLIAETSACP